MVIKLIIKKWEIIGVENLVLSSTLVGNRHGSTNHSTSSLCSFSLASSLSFLKKTQHRGSEVTTSSVPCSVAAVSPNKKHKNENRLFEAEPSLPPQKHLPQVAPHPLLRRPRFPYSLLPLPLLADFPCSRIPISSKRHLITAPRSSSH